MSYEQGIALQTVQDRLIKPKQLISKENNFIKLVEKVIVNRVLNTSFTYVRYDTLTIELMGSQARLFSEKKTVYCIICHDVFCQ